jgi:hypothetical protein
VGFLHWYCKEELKLVGTALIHKTTANMGFDGG